VEEEKIAVAIAEMGKDISFIKKGQEQLQKTLDDWKAGNDKELSNIWKKIDERIKESDTNQNRLEKEINELKKNYAVIAAVASVLSILALKALDFIF
jgi:uncharacterized protein (DUF2252 family)